MPYKEDFSTEKSKVFFKNVLKVTKKLEERKKATQTLRRRFKKLKKTVAEEKASKKVLESEIKKLERSIIDVLKKEGIILKHEDEESATIRRLNNYIIDLKNKLRASQEKLTEESEVNRRRVNQIRENLAKLNSRVNELIELRNARLQRIEELEKKIRNTVSFEKHKIIAIEEHLSNLEKKYLEMKKTGYPVEHIEEKIAATRERLEKAKQEKLTAFR